MDEVLEMRALHQKCHSKCVLIVGRSIIVDSEVILIKTKKFIDTFELMGDWGMILKWIGFYEVRA